MKARNVLILGFAMAVSIPLHALTESELVGTWSYTSYLAVRETDQGSYQLLIGDTQRHPEYALVTAVVFQRNGLCLVTRSSPAGGTTEVSARYQKQTIDGQETLRLKLGDDEVSMTIRVIEPGEVRTLFFLSTSRGIGVYAPYVYDTFGTMEKLEGAP